MMPKFTLNIIILPQTMGFWQVFLYTFCTIFLLFFLIIKICYKDFIKISYNVTKQKYFCNKNVKQQYFHLNLSEFLLIIKGAAASHAAAPCFKYKLVNNCKFRILIEDMKLICFKSYIDCIADFCC